MSYGIEINNSEGYLKIDENSEQLVIFKRGQTTGNSSATATYEQYFDFFPIKKVMVSPVTYWSGSRYLMLEAAKTYTFVTDFEMFPVQHPGDLYDVYYNLIQLYGVEVFANDVTHVSIEPFYYFLMTTMGEIEAYNQSHPLNKVFVEENEFGLEVMNPAGERVFSSAAEHAEISFASVIPKADFLTSDTFILPSSLKRRYIDVSPFSKTHYMVGATEYFSAKFFRFEDNNTIATLGKTWDQNFSDNTTRTDPGYIDTTVLISESHLNG